MKNEMGIIKIEANHFITGFLQTTISESGFDECTACGMLFQNIATQMGQAEQKWERMKKKNNIPTLEELDWVEAELERMDKQKKAKKD
ncbi:MAG: hypothetical protein GY710_21515 [Desulfobacteraceae bacterium]|nr:hypothetical protein [Desulfobacteraceae bacterium]